MLKNVMRGGHQNDQIWVVDIKFWEGDINFRVVDVKFWEMNSKKGGGKQYMATNQNTMHLLTFIILKIQLVHQICLDNCAYELEIGLGKLKIQALQWLGIWKKMVGQKVGWYFISFRLVSLPNLLKNTP